MEWFLGDIIVPNLERTPDRPFLSFGEELAVDTTTKAFNQVRCTLERRKE